MELQAFGEEGTDFDGLDGRLVEQLVGWLDGWLGQRLVVGLGEVLWSWRVGGGEG